MKSFFLPQWCVLLALINDNEVKFLSEKFENDTTITFLSKKTGFNYSNVEKIIKFLEKEGLIKTEKRHRSKFILLTSKGKDLSFHLCKLKLML
jgi:predicted transcriptional regulator